MSDIVDDILRAVVCCLFAMITLLYASIFASSVYYVDVPPWLVWTAMAGPPAVALPALLLRAARAYGRHRASHRGAWHPAIAARR